MDSRSNENNNWLMSKYQYEQPQEEEGIVFSRRLTPDMKGTLLEPPIGWLYPEIDNFQFDLGDDDPPQQKHKTVKKINIKYRKTFPKDC